MQNYRKNSLYGWRHRYSRDVSGNFWIVIDTHFWNILRRKIRRSSIIVSTHLFDVSILCRYGRGRMLMRFHLSYPLTSPLMHSVDKLHPCSRINLRRNPNGFRKFDVENIRSSVAHSLWLNYISRILLKCLRANI